MHRIRRPSHRVRVNSFVSRVLTKVFPPGKHRLGVATLSIADLLGREGAWAALNTISA